MTSHSNEGGGIQPPAERNPRTDPPLDFPDRDFGDLTPADYDALGFMAGLEVHQQIDTRSKLFCRCPAGRYVNRHDAVVLRHMRPTLSELGEYDGTALMEFKTRKEIVYRLERSTVCTYEIDDTPPFAIDEEAVRIAIEMSQLFGLSLVSELHVMRKQYLDGSIPTGFQRTAMIGLDGAIPFAVPELGIDRPLRIRQLSLEEDSCREISDVGHVITFRTDRLGMPLTETVTEPELMTPLEVQAAGWLIAEVARATGKVRRGPGAARQDVNVSVAGGRRVEIKGVYHHRRLPQLVHIEAFRQLNLLRIKAELECRGVEREIIAPPDGEWPWEASASVAGVDALVRHAGYRPIEEALDRGEMVCAVRLPGFGGLLNHRTQPSRDFAYEFGERVRVIACPVHRPFLLHSDAGDALGGGRWRELRAAVGADDGDAVVLVWALERDAATAARELLIRAAEALGGIPAETRQAHADGTSGFERILPGPDRMYPDTDTPPLPIDDDVVEQIRVASPERPWNRAARYADLGIDPRPAWALAVAPWADLFDEVDPDRGDVARRLAASLAKRIPHGRRAGHDLPVAERLRPAVRAIEEEEIQPEALDRILDAVVREPEADPNEILRRFRPGSTDDADLEHAVADVAQRASALAGRSSETLLRWAMGEIMPRFLGKHPARRVREALVESLSGEPSEVAS